MDCLCRTQTVTGNHGYRKWQIHAYRIQDFYWITYA